MDDLNFDFCFKCYWHVEETHPGQKFTSIPENVQVGRKPVMVREDDEQSQEESDKSDLGREENRDPDGGGGEERDDDGQQDDHL
jgi:hypothetical protein